MERYVREFIQQNEDLFNEMKKDLNESSNIEIYETKWNELQIVFEKLVNDFNSKLSKVKSDTAKERNEFKKEITEKEKLIRNLELKNKAEIENYENEKLELKRAVKQMTVSASSKDKISNDYRQKLEAKTKECEVLIKEKQGLRERLELRKMEVLKHERDFKLLVQDLADKEEKAATLLNENEEFLELLENTKQFLKQASERDLNHQLDKEKYEDQISSLMAIAEELKVENFNLKETNHKLDEDLAAKNKSR
jgi:hypothetical protein